MAKFERKWTIVQHSGYGYGGNPAWQQALETRTVATAKEARLVEKVGGVLFDSYKEAEDTADEWNYPNHAGLYPQARGTFSPEKIDDLAIYIPVRKVRVIG